MNILDISDAFNGLEQPIQLIQQNNSINESINVPTKIIYNVFGVLQPLDLRKLRITPAEQAEFGTHMFHIRQSLLQRNNITLTLLNSQNFLIVYNGTFYRAVGKWLYNDYGYAQVDAIVNRN